ncbi:STAS domain-containing protein [Actinoplanes sp. NBRC 101535]|uniref:STAS domain-containing protein n=1 Tax=Actinoplanes sp. NBRC 101535 TaxID=3032196 RepID=UPI00249F9D8E|nr:STAS domain-containing protein [Actinoplanes sp. NBRC 101535]GLY02135.1 hypothetical protein Acsp01_25140 [Actinoplanes sp. NBRC 101535]
MTAVSDASGVELICDGCGEVASAGAYGLHDTESVHAAVTGSGWTGSSFARGPHRCPSCVAPPRSLAVDIPDLSEIAVEMFPAAAVIRVTGDVSIDAIGPLRQALDESLAARPSVIVDLSGAGTVDPPVLSTLVRARNLARRHRSEVLLAGPSRFVRMTMRTRLRATFRTFTTVDQALIATAPAR